MKSGITLIIVMILGALLLWSCKNIKSEGLSLTPIAGAEKMPVTSKIELQSPFAIDPVSLTYNLVDGPCQGILQVKVQSGSQCLGLSLLANPDNLHFTFTPIFNLLYSSQYELKLEGQLQELAGPMVEISLQQSFNTNSFSILVYGDSRTGHQAHQSLVDVMVGLNPDLVLHTGDLVDSGDDPWDWEAFDQITENLTTLAPLLPVLGNHDLPKDLFVQRFPLATATGWYSQVYEPFLLVFLDANQDLSLASPQRAWLDAELAMVRPQVIHKLVILHYPIYSGGPHGGDLALQDSLMPLLTANAVKIVFAGHDHLYEHSQQQGIHFMVTGGGGAPIHTSVSRGEGAIFYYEGYHFCRLQPKGGQIQVEVFDVLGRVIETFTIP